MYAAVNIMTPDSVGLQAESVIFSAAAPIFKSCFGRKGEGIIKDVQGSDTVVRRNVDRTIALL